MPTQLPFSKTIARLQKIFLGENIKEGYFASKKELLKTLKRNPFDQEIILAFFLPDNLNILEKYKGKIIKLLGQNVYELKTKALEILQKEDRLKEISQITDPLNPISQTIALVLLEIIAILKKKNRVSKEFVQVCQQYWIPIANNFGLWKIRYIIEDALFELDDPESYQLIVSVLAEKSKMYQELLNDIISIVHFHLQKAGLKDFEVFSRKKNIYGIYKKMQTQGISINHVADLFGIRIIVKSKNDCYKALGILHRLWPHYSDRLRDWIKSPKGNNYRSLHTTLQCLGGKPVEFQIRTPEMDYIAKFGPASHSRYKNG